MIRLKGVFNQEQRRHLLKDHDRIGALSFSVLAREKQPLVIDTRPPHEYTIGHLPNAINIPMQRLCRAELADIVRQLGTDFDKMKERGDIPMQRLCRSGLADIVRQLDTDCDKMKERGVYVICRRGNDSQDAVLHLREKFKGLPVCIKDIIGGYQKWSQIVDKDFPIY
ncbi:unnamed protein product [Gongylonema pulchrum]|uniref:Rhodanese domain-containing protein n=1 Tax=Gongylonema pulchrum TaxID=637853 RepID=A0A183EPF1_9BILA|nr:unnamed protein product [Gongylonema pulchrum]